MLKLPETISEAEFLERLKAVERPKTKLAFLLGFYQCMRVSEVVKLQPADVDRERGFLHILAGKGNKDRDVPIAPPVEKGLKHLPIGKGSRTLERWAKRFIGLKFHALRHSGATFYLNQKKRDIRHIQQFLGHSRLSTTQIYTHVTPAELKEAFGGIWNNNE